MLNQLIDMEKQLSINTFAKKAGISRPKVYKMIKKGYFDTFPDGKPKLTEFDALKLRLLQSGETYLDVHDVMDLGYIHRKLHYHTETSKDVLESLQLLYDNIQGLKISLDVKYYVVYELIEIIYLYMDKWSNTATEPFDMSLILKDSHYDVMFHELMDLKTLAKHHKDRLRETNKISESITLDDQQRRIYKLLKLYVMYIPMSEQTFYHMVLPGLFWYLKVIAAGEYSANFNNVRVKLMELIETILKLHLNVK